MASGDITEQAWLALHALEDGRRALMGRLVRSPLYRWRSSVPAVKDFFLIPQDLRTADPSFFTEVQDGHFGLAGILADLDPQNLSPFRVPRPNPHWERELHGFGWLRHLRACEDEEAEAYARRLVREWLSPSVSRRPRAQEIAVTARRLMSWFSHAPLLFAPDDVRGHRRVMASLTRQIRILAASQKHLPEGLTRLMSLIALTYASLCLEGQDGLAETFGDALSRELDAQILPDGGHVSRNPQVAVELVLDLLPLKQCFVAREQTPPEALTRAISRMTTMIRYLRLGDGSLARFNGMGATQFDAVATAMAYEDIGRTLPPHASFSAYCRLQRGSTIIVMDVGQPPPLPHAAQAHAGPLSFEMSVGRHLLVVNCGAPNPAEQDHSVSARMTAAHSTLSLGETATGRFLRRAFFTREGKNRYLVGPGSVTAKLSENRSGDIQLTASHDGYLKAYGVVHERDVTLKSNGLRIEGRDRLRASTRSELGVPFFLRFHLHPSVSVTALDEPGTFLLTPANGPPWRFHCHDAHVTVEKSYFLATQHGPVPSQQIVISGPAHNRVQIHWTFQDEKAHQHAQRLRQAAQSLQETARKMKQKKPTDS